MIVAVDRDQFSDSPIQITTAMIEAGTDVLFDFESEEVHGAAELIVMKIFRDMLLAARPHPQQ